MDPCLTPVGSGLKEFPARPRVGLTLSGRPSTAPVVSSSQRATNRPTKRRSDDLTEIEISTRRRRSLNTEGKRGRLRSGLPPFPRARDVRPGMVGGESEESRENFTSCGSPVCVMLIVLTRSRCERFTFPCMPASVELVAARGVAGLGSGKQTYKRIGRFCRRLQLISS